MIVATVKDTLKFQALGQENGWCAEIPGYTIQLWVLQALGFTQTIM